MRVAAEILFLLKALVRGVDDKMIAIIYSFQNHDSLAGVLLLKTYTAKVT